MSLIEQIIKLVEVWRVGNSLSMPDLRKAAENELLRFGIKPEAGGYIRLHTGERIKL